MPKATTKRPSYYSELTTLVRQYDLVLEETYYNTPGATYPWRVEFILKYIDGSSIARTEATSSSLDRSLDIASYVPLTFIKHRTSSSKPFFP